MNKFPFISTKQSMVVFRIVLALIMIAHGVMRIYQGTVSNFGEFLDSQGFLIGTSIAWGITSFEIVGGLLLILNRYRKLICALFAAQLTMGIILVHAQFGWFVVGHGGNGMEYSVLLVVSFLVIAAKED
jgi:putative oxidoreductase